MKKEGLTEMTSRLSFANYGETKLPQDELLEEISRKVDCMYISDLQHSNLLPLIRTAVKELSIDRYSLREWNDAVSYITGKDCEFKSQKEAADYLMKYRF